MVVRATRKVVLLASLAAVASVIGQASAASSVATSARCSVHAGYQTGQVSGKGAMVGSVRCGRPLGKGSYHGRYRDNVNPSPFTGMETGSSKLSFRAGTIRGTYTIDQGPISGTAPWQGTFHITGGSRRFKHVAGTLKMSCAHRIPPLSDCTMSGPVSGI